MSSKQKQKQKSRAAIKSNKDLKNNNYVQYFILGITAVIFYIYSNGFNFIQDDSFITFRYVKNFTEGNGLVFNIGERVEGYTCFLWVIFLSFVKLIGANFISISQSIGILFSIAALFFTFKISSDIFEKPGNEVYKTGLNILAVLLLLSNGALAYWSVSGMETSMFTFLVTLGIYFYLKESRSKSKFDYSSLILLLASLTRPEGVVIFTVTLIHKIVFTIRENSKNEEKENLSKILFSKQNLKWLGMFLIPGLIYMIWRLSYFGYLLPNTFYAKTGSSIEYFKTGLDYFIEFSKTYGIYGILYIPVLFSLRNNKNFREIIYLISIYIIFSLYIISVGGDVLRPSRFFVPILPVFYLLVQEGLYIIVIRMTGEVKLKAVTLICLVTIIIAGYYTYKTQYDTIKKYSELENGLVEKMKISAQWLKKKSQENGKPLTVAATTIGAISYYSETNLIDMLGLTDKEIAHNPKPIHEISENASIGWKERQYNVDYVISRKPDYIYFSTGMKPSAYAERGLFTNDEFIKYYYPYYFAVKEYKFQECIYKRKNENDFTAKEFQPNPKYSKTFVNLYNQAINTSRDKNKLQEALNLFNQTIEVSPPNFSGANQMIGDIYTQLKNKDKAIQNYQIAVEKNDFDVMAQTYLYQYHYENGDTIISKKIFEKLKKIDPDLF
jgi:arabinofuranosyltransferase